MRVVCEQCGNEFERCVGHVNRARKKGYGLFCGRRCAGLARRTTKTKAQRVAEKAEYDREYRARNSDMLKRKKAAYHKRTYDPAKAAVERKKRSAAHAEYCRRPEYRAWKRKYDKKHRARKMFGEFADAYLVLGDLDREVLSRMSRYEIGLANGTINKALTRKRIDAAISR